ncbi:hypothetical protein AAFF_G00428210 [Aldrovandia affinis]|uniref:Uncharacterized protein n=1 Tax=Aldrovandia affinis TaxID=143900 RepID=A0AAD7S905_9TELE|nr:hypothetical protein AAFF_G00428210 [Aldrovandia affinis]
MTLLLEELRSSTQRPPESGLSPLWIRDEGALLALALNLLRLHSLTYTSPPPHGPRPASLSQVRALVGAVCPSSLHTCWACRLLPLRTPVDSSPSGRELREEKAPNPKKESSRECL